MRKRSDAIASATTTTPTTDRSVVAPANPSNIDLAGFMKDAQTSRDAAAVATSTAPTAVGGAEVGVGPNVFPTADVGEEVTVTRGEDLYSPMQFHSFRVGPYTTTTRVRAGENRCDAMRRALLDLERVAATDAKERTRVFLANVADIKAWMR